MVAEQLTGRGITDERVLFAMANVKRELFVAEAQQAKAYDDTPLSIGLEQTISQPFMVAKMAELCVLSGGERVLEVGGGSGYAAAILARLCDRVISIEIRPTLATLAQQALVHAGVKNVEVMVGDGTIGWRKNAPYDAIVVSAGAPAIPAPLVAQLAPGGRLIVPVGDRLEQWLLMVRRDSEGIRVEREIACRFVELRGEYGW